MILLFELRTVCMKSKYAIIFVVKLLSKNIIISNNLNYDSTTIFYNKSYEKFLVKLNIDATLL